MVSNRNIFTFQLPNVTVFAEFFEFQNTVTDSLKGAIFYGFGAKSRTMVFDIFADLIIEPEFLFTGK